MRVGFGEGEQVADGRWVKALELPARRARAPRRDAALRPQERLGALLGGRDAVLACEELALRARQDVDAGRRREAALQLDAALTAALAELEPWSPRGDLADAPGRAARPARRRPGRGAGARCRAASTTRTPPRSGTACERLEAALRARTALGFD